MRFRQISSKSFNQISFICFAKFREIYNNDIWRKFRETWRKLRVVMKLSEISTKWIAVKKPLVREKNQFDRTDTRILS